MRRHASRVTLVSAIALALGAYVLAPSIAAGIPDEQWSRDPSASTGALGYQGIIINDALNRGTKVDMFSLLTAHVDTPVGDYVCASTTAENCAGAAQYTYFAILPPCANDSSKDCIAGITAYRDGVLLGSGTYKETIYPDHPDAFQGDDSMFIPTPSEPSIWSIPSAAHSKGSEYLISVGLNGRTSARNPAPASAFFANIYAIERTNSTGASSQSGLGKYGIACEQQSINEKGAKSPGVVSGLRPIVQCGSLLGTLGNAPGGPACLSVYDGQGHCLLRDPMDLSLIHI